MEDIRKARQVADNTLDVEDSRDDDGAASRMEGILEDIQVASGARLLVAVSSPLVAYQDDEGGVLVVLEGVDQVVEQNCLAAHLDVVVVVGKVPLDSVVVEVEAVVEKE